MGERLKKGIACRRYAIMVANLRRNITRIFVKNINNHHIIAIIKRWHHRENNRWGFVGTIIAYLRHASDRGVSLPRVGNIFDVTNPGLTTIAYLRHAARSTRPWSYHNRVSTTRFWWGCRYPRLATSSTLPTWG